MENKTKQNLKFQTRKIRYFSEDFKQQKVNEILQKKITIKEISSIYQVAVQVIYRWLYKYSPESKSNVKIIVEMQTEAQKTLFYKEKVAELERIVGQKQIELDFLNKLIEIASEELQTDIKKNFAIRLLKSCEKNVNE